MKRYTIYFILYCFVKFSPVKLSTFFSFSLYYLWLCLCIEAIGSHMECPYFWENVSRAGQGKVFVLSSSCTLGIPG